MNIEELIDETETITVKQIPLSDQKSYLIRNVNSLAIDQRRELGQILIRAGKKSLLRINAEGTIINLDLAPPELVTIMYNYMCSKLAI